MVCSRDGCFYASGGPIGDFSLDPVKPQSSTKLVEKECPWCKRTYMPFSANQPFCSKTCKERKGISDRNTRDMVKVGGRMNARCVGLRWMM